MQPTIERRRFASLGILVVLHASATGCGTILHPERRGQAAGELDWGIVALNTVGLLFFFVPGVIAFAVDFNNGTIYLPSNPSTALAGATGGVDDQTFVSVAVPHKRLTSRTIEQTVAHKTGLNVCLSPGAYRTQKLERLDEFWSTWKKFQLG